MSATPDQPENVPNEPEVVIEPLSSEEAAELEAVVEETPDAEIVVADSDVGPEAADGKYEIVKIAGGAAALALAVYLFRPDHKRTTTFKKKVTFKKPDGSTLTTEITETHIDHLINAAPAKALDRLMTLLLQCKR